MSTSEQYEYNVVITPGYKMKCLHEMPEKA